MSTETKKSSAWMWWLLGIAIIGLIAYFIWKYITLPKVLSDKLGNNPTYNAGGGLLTDYGDEVNTDKVLFFGEKSNNVTRLQIAVNDMITKYDYSYTKLSVDGDFGAKTLAAIKYISGDTLNSGTVTVNKVMSLPKLPTVGALNPPPTTSGAEPSAAPTFTGGKFAKYKN